jgi:hypothetical protein
MNVFEYYVVITFISKFSTCSQYVFKTLTYVNILKTSKFSTIFDTKTSKPNIGYTCDSY